MTVPVLACEQRGNRLDWPLSRFSAPAPMAASTTTTIEVRELESHRQALYKFALLQLRNETHAEDCVQETLMAAIQSAARFSGGSSVRTWLVGILKHKIIDHFRKASREIQLDADDAETSLDDFDGL